MKHTPGRWIDADTLSIRVTMEPGEVKNYDRNRETFKREIYTPDREVAVEVMIDLRLMEPLTKAIKAKSGKSGFGYGAVKVKRIGPKPTFVKVEEG